MQNFVFTYLIAHFLVLLGLHLESEGFVWANPPVIVYMSAGKGGEGDIPEIPNSGLGPWALVVLVFLLGLAVIIISCLWFFCGVSGISSVDPGN